MPTSQTVTYSGQGIVPHYQPNKPLITNVKLPPDVTLAKGTVLGQVVGSGTAVNEVQTLTITGVPTGGTFTISYRGQTTTAIAHNATAATVQAALVALSTIGAGNVTCTGGALPGAAVVITFTGDFAGSVRTLATATGAFTGGTDPAIAIALTTAGKPAGGYFAAYDDDASNGLEVARAILQWNCATDSVADVTFGLVSGSADFNRTGQVAPAYFSGYFLISDLTGLDAAAVVDFGKIISGSISSTGAVLQVGG